jgi:acyl-CoA thioester hydrolase
MLTVTTAVQAMTGARLVLEQTVARDGTPLFRATVTLVALTETGAPARLPAALRGRLH